MDWILNDSHDPFFVSLAEFSTWLSSVLKPSPNTVHHLLTHYRWMWDILNNVRFLRDALMRYVLTCTSNRTRFKSSEFKLIRIIIIVISFIHSEGEFSRKPADLQRRLRL